jgi:maltooligosyltrehalose trehalohydrolase
VEHDPADEWFMVLRGDVLAIVVNFGEDEATVPLEGESSTLFGNGELRFEVEGDQHLFRMAPRAVALLKLEIESRPGR